MFNLDAAFLLVYKVFMGLCSIIVLIGVNVLRKFDNRMTENTNRLHQQEKDHLDFKLDVEKRYAKEETVQHSLGRLQDRIDGIGARIDGIGKSIETILIAVKR